MKRTLFALLGLAIAAGASLVLGQTRPLSVFSVVRQIGSIPRDNFIVEPQTDRLIRVLSRSIILEDARTFAETLTLDVEGTIYASSISHDATKIAVAVDRRVEVWSLQTGERLVSIEPPATNYVTAPLMFSDDDTFLSFVAVVPASQATRRSENDTDLLPWVWDLNAVLDLGDSRLPGRVDAYSFFDYRAGGLFLGPNNILLGAIVGAYHLIDLDDPPLLQDSGVQSTRFENDPISLWFSAAGDLMYVRDPNTSTFIRFDTRTLGDGSDFVRPGQVMNTRQPAGNQGRAIGELRTLTLNPLVRDLFGYDYRADWNYHPLTVHLFDVLQPITEAAGLPQILLSIIDDTAGTSTIEALVPPNEAQFAIDPSWTRLALREPQNGAVTIYDLNSGLPLLRFTPAIGIGDRGARTPFSYTANGEALIIGHGRYDAFAGAPLIEFPEQIYGFDRYFFNEDSTLIYTMSGSTWRTWEVATGRLLRTETLNYGDGSVRALTPSGTRALIDTFVDGKPAMTVYDVASQARATVVFETPPDMRLVDVVPNPAWTNFLLRFAPADASNPHGSTGALAIYNLNDGLRTYIAGADLPPNAGAYGWLDDEQAYIAGEAGDQIDRIYGVAYAPSGVPVCLVDAYPDRLEAWTPIWERLAYYLPPDELANLAIRICAAPDAAAVAALYTPTPVNTRQPDATPASSRIVGVPICLTSSFSNQALAYANEWRRITNGLTEEQISELADLVCAGLTGEFAGGYTPRVGTVDRRIVYAIDASSGRRTRITDVPGITTDPFADVDFIANLYFTTYSRPLNEPVLSPDRRFILQRNDRTLELIALMTPFETLKQQAAEAAAATLGAQPNIIRVLPTATALPQVIGLPQPTLTPTIIPTFIPLPQATAQFSAAGEVREVCPNASAVPFEARSSAFQAAGRLIGTVHDSDAPAVLDAASAELTLDETISGCVFGLPCSFSLDFRWVLTGEATEPVVMRPDGTQATRLYAQSETPVVLQGAAWLDEHRVQLTVSVYRPSEWREPRTRVQLYDVRNGSYGPLQAPQADIQINGLPTTYISSQPNGGPLRIASTPLKLPGGTGARYYLVNSETGEQTYFAATGADQTLSAEWHPYGRWLRYWVDETQVYLYDPVAGTHRLLTPPMDLPTGTLSRDGRFWLAPVYLSFDEREQRELEGRPLPTLSLTDDQTGEQRLYCVPDAWQAYGDVAWSDDGRYVAFLAPRPGDQFDQTRPYNTVYALDTHTGEVVDMKADMQSLALWLADVEADS